jgi:hypothetical protein
VANESRGFRAVEDQLYATGAPPDVHRNGTAFSRQRHLEIDAIEADILFG